MAFIGVKVPAEVATSLSHFNVPGEKVTEDEMHVTLLYLGNNIPMPEVLQATMACYLTTKKWVPFTAVTRRITTFPGSDGKIPVIAKVLCPELHRLNDALKKSLSAMEIEYSKKFPEFKPHITLSYSTEEMKDVRIQQHEWQIQELVIWGGDHGEERIAITLPFEGQKEVVALAV